MKEQIEWEKWQALKTGRAKLKSLLVIQHTPKIKNRKHIIPDFPENDVLPVVAYNKGRHKAGPYIFS